MSDQTIAVSILSEACAHWLEGNSPQIQGATIADLMARYLAAHVVRDRDRKAEREIRQAHFDTLTRTIWELVAIYDKARDEG